MTSADDSSELAEARRRLAELELLRRRRFDLMLLDVLMPELDGY